MSMKTCGQCKHIGKKDGYGSHICKASVKLARKTERTLSPCLYLSPLTFGVEKSTRATHCQMWEEK